MIYDQPVITQQRQRLLADVIAETLEPDAMRRGKDPMMACNA
jgi:hypothetical protein